MRFPRTPMPLDPIDAAPPHARPGLEMVNDTLCEDINNQLNTLVTMLSHLDLDELEAERIYQNTQRNISSLEKLKADISAEATNRCLNRLLLTPDNPPEFQPLERPEDRPGAGTIVRRLAVIVLRNPTIGPAIEGIITAYDHVEFCGAQRDILNAIERQITDLQKRAGAELDETRRAIEVEKTNLNERARRLENQKRAMRCR